MSVTTRSVVICLLAMLAIVGQSISQSYDHLQPDLNPIPRLVPGNFNNLQPGINPVPQLGGNFTNKPEDWVHSTPLLQKTRIPAIDTINPPVHRRATSSWQGWQNVHYLFSFGDSYTSTNFTIDGDQPNPSNPLGNPVYPGATSADGPNYIDFLTTTYNQSYIQTYNFGYGGATVNDSIVDSGFGPAVQSFQDQVQHEFIPRYAHNSEVPWTASDTLFSIFFGINDLGKTYMEGNDSINYDVIQSYQILVDELYSAGARNFLFLNVPPVDRSPGTLELSSSDQAQEAAYIGTYNFRLGALVYNVALRHTGTTSFLFDTNFLFTRVLDDPGQFEETAGYKNTTGYCEAYAEWVLSGYTNGPSLEAELTFPSGTPTLTYFDPACGVSVDEYFWLNTLHPTYPMHNFMGSQIVQLLEMP